MTIGILGTGQLGRMLCIEAKQLGFYVIVYGPGGDASPAGQVADESIEASYTDSDALQSFAQKCDVITYEFENIDIEHLYALNEITPIYPHPNLLKTTQHRIWEKTWLTKIGCQTTPFLPVSSTQELQSAFETYGNGVIKTNRFGYDGKGQVKITADTNFKEAFESLQTEDVIFEAWASFEKEISIIVARNKAGDVQIYPAFENIHQNHILHTTHFPARIDDFTAQKAQVLARTIAEESKLVGILTIELFVQKDGELLVNELAPRVHNSGHITQNTAVTNQFEQQIRAITGLPLGSPEIITPGKMINILGDELLDGSFDIATTLQNSTAKLHLYGKAEARIGRKMGHVNYIG